jgi:hypothetical protein
VMLCLHCGEAGDAGSRVLASAQVATLCILMIRHSNM